MGSRWVAFEYGTIDRADIPQKPGCYAIYCDGTLFYVGSSTSLVERIWNGHKFRFGYSPGVITPWGKCKKLVIKYSVTRKFGDWTMRELRLINRLRPPFNKTGLPGSRRKKLAEVPLGG